MGKKASEGNFGTVDGSDIQCSPIAEMRSLPGALLPGAHPRGGPSGPSGSPLGIPLQSDKVTGQGQLPSRAGFIQRPGNLGRPESADHRTRPGGQTRNERGACQAVWRPDGGALEATRPPSPSRVQRDTGRVAQLRVLGFGISEPRRSPAGRGARRKCGWGHVT